MNYSNATLARGRRSRGGSNLCELRLPADLLRSLTAATPAAMAMVPASPARDYDRCAGDCLCHCVRPSLALCEIRTANLRDGSARAARSGTGPFPSQGAGSPYPACVKAAPVDNGGVVRIGRCAAVLALATISLAGCGGSSRTAPVTSTAAASSRVVVASSNGTVLPTSSSGPMTCTVYDSGYATQVIFASRTIDVRGDCGAWIRNKAGEGYLWGYQPARADAVPAESRQVCYLTDPAGIVAVRVIEATGFRSVSVAQAARASSACVRLVGFGWAKQPGSNHQPRSRPHRRTRLP
jgi:hypothetical protein